MSHLPTTPYPRFHLACPVTDLAEARRFYGSFLGCAEGRSSPEWVDFDFFGHQIVAHKVESAAMADATSLVDGQNVPVRHFGVVRDEITARVSNAVQMMNNAPAIGRSMKIQ